MEAILDSNLLTGRQASKTARLAASLFFFLCIPLFFWEQTVSSKIFVAQDPVATANNLLSHEFIFRAATVSHLAGNIIFVMMVLMFCRLFRPVDKHLTRIMAAFILVQIPIVLILEVFNIAALMTLIGISKHHRVRPRDRRPIRSWDALAEGGERRLQLGGSVQSPNPFRELST